MSRKAPDAEEDDAPRRPPVSNTPQPFAITPFDLASCTLHDPVSEAQQLAFSAHVRAHATRAAFWEHAPAADWMLDLLRTGWHVIPVVPEAPLRTFALRCVEKLQGADAPRLAELRAAVQRRITGEVTPNELAAVQAKTRPFVTPGGVQGLPRCSPYAAGQLAVWHTANPDPYEAAMWSADFAARHDAFVTLTHAAQSWTPTAAVPDGWRVAFYAQQHPDVQARALREANERLAVLLKSILPQPFGEAVVQRRVS